MRGVDSAGGLVRGPRLGAGRWVSRCSWRWGCARSREFESGARGDLRCTLMGRSLASCAQSHLITHAQHGTRTVGPGDTDPAVRGVRQGYGGVGGRGGGQSRMRRTGV